MLVGIGIVLAIVAIAAVVVVPKYLKPSDPGCQAYAGPALTAYNKTINDLNAQASQATLAADMSASVSSLQTAIGKAHAASVKTALNGLLTELKSVQADVGSGSVPTDTVDALNNASNAADHACS
jgi:hypothetical protein